MRTRQEFPRRRRRIHGDDSWPASCPQNGFRFKSFNHAALPKLPHRCSTEETGFWRGWELRLMFHMVLYGTMLVLILGIWRIFR
jgi:hypothetical protein